MALEHEFFKLSSDITNNISESKIIEFYQNNKYSAICIHDNYILPNINAFIDVDTLDPYNEYIVLRKGLNYYGFTIIMPNNLTQFTEVLKKISVDHEFDPLISICEEAYLHNVAILHVGI